MFAVLLMVVLSGPIGAADRQYVDLIEYNVCGGTEPGIGAIRQLIFRKWSPDRYRYEVVAWCLVEQESRLPRRVGDWWVADICVPRTGKDLRVMAKLYRETRTRKDPEMLERQAFPECLREGFIRASR